MRRENEVQSQVSLDDEETGKLAAASAGPAWRWIATVALAAVTGYLFTTVHAPIPWMIGPLFVVAAGRLAGWPLLPPPGARQMGQWIIGTALGLYFSSSVVRQVAGLFPLMLVAALASVLVGFLSGSVLAVLSGVNRPTAFFASVPGGAMEMSVLGERFGARVDRVAAAQSLRILIVVSLVPWAYVALGVHGAERYLQASSGVRVLGLAALLGASALGALMLQRLRVPNAWMLGSLFVAGPLTALQADLSAMPSWLSNAGQLLLGCALGARFRPDFLHTAPRFLGAVAVSVVAAIILSAFFALGLGLLVDLVPATLILATAPGGIAEMCITAKVLQLGVPIVTAFHVTRVIVLVTASGPLFGLLDRRRSRRGA
jgi:membrane AbrB-like protein